MPLAALFMCMHLVVARSAGYIAPFAMADLTWNVTYAFPFYMVLGDLATIRAYAYANKQGPAQVLTADLQEAATLARWTRVGECVDVGGGVFDAEAGVILGGCRLVSSPAVWQAADVPALAVSVGVRGVAGSWCHASTCSVTITVTVAYLPLEREVWGDRAALAAATAGTLLRSAASTLPRRDAAALGYGGATFASEHAQTSEVVVEVRGDELDSWVWAHVAVPLSQSPGYSGPIQQVAITAAAVGDGGAALRVAVRSVAV